VEKNQIQYHPDRNHSRDSISQYTVYAASTRKSCRAWAGNASLLITSGGSDYLSVLTFLQLLYNRIKYKSSKILRYDMVFYSCCDDNTVSLCLIVIKKDRFLQALGFNLECQFACKNMVLMICTCRPWNANPLQVKGRRLQNHGQCIVYFRTY
jgi:hypothetical protein